MIKSSLLSPIAGLGVPSDGSLDSCRIIQGTSGELKRGDRRYLPEARIGAFRFEGRDPPIIDGEQGFHAQILHVNPAYIETPADGSLGQIAKYQHAPADASWLEEVDQNGKKRRVFRRVGNRNILQRTLFLSFALVDEQGVDFDSLYVLRAQGKALGLFTETFTKPMSRRSMWVRAEDGKLYQLPVFGVFTHILSELASKDKGDWYIPVVNIEAKYGDPEGPTDEEIAVGREIFEEREARAILNYDPAPEDAGPPAPPAPPEPIAAPVSPTPQLGSQGAIETTGTAGTAGTAGTTGTRFSSGHAKSPNDNVRPFAARKDHHDDNLNEPEWMKDLPLPEEGPPDYEPNYGFDPDPPIPF
jgi:hypothetical protein